MKQQESSHDQTTNTYVHALEYSRGGTELCTQNVTNADLREREKIEIFFLARSSVFRLLGCSVRALSKFLRFPFLNRNKKCSLLSLRVSLSLSVRVAN